MNHIFHESELTFYFNRDWKVLRYDEHKYYRIVSGRSVSGVDFACITPDETLLLIEVKNFYQYNRSGLIDDTNRFAEEIKEKIVDTLDLITIIHKYHRRKWTFRIMIDLVRRFPKLHYDWWFWSKMYDLHLQPEKLLFLLVLESETEVSSLQKQITELIMSEGVEVPPFHILPASEIQAYGINI